MQKEFTEFKVDAWRTEILDFSDTCMNHQRHTKEQFDHVIDILDKYEKYIAENKIASQKELDDIRSSVNAEVQDAIKFAEDSPFPAPEETLLHVYAD